MNTITTALSVAVLVTQGLALTVRGWAADAQPAKADQHATITVRVNDATAGAGMNQFEYAGKWTHQSAYNNNCHEGDISFSNTAGDTMRIRFFGTRVRLYGVRAAHLGTGMVSMDDGEEREAVFRAPSNEYKILAYESPVLPAGLHTLKLRVTDGYSVPDYVEIDTPRGEPARIEIPGSDSELVPKAGSISVRYSSCVLNANGYAIPGETAAWSLQSPVKGVSLDAKTGVVTVNSTAEVGGAFILVATAGAVQASKTVALPAPTFTQTLVTADTSLTLCVAGNKMYIASLKNPDHGWNWTPAPSPVPLPGVNGKQVAWTFRDAVEMKTDGHVVTLRFTCAEPALELQSVWRARPGVGPVEHQPTIRNDSTGAVSFADVDLVAAQLNLISDQQARLFPWAGGRLGYGEGNPLPYQMIQVGTAHGVYLAYDYGCGKFASTVTGNQIASRWWAAGIKNTATAAGETFRCPGIMIQAYQGDEDDGANHFRRWFWNHEVPRSLYENPNDPPVEICEHPDVESKPDRLIEMIKTRNFASWGIGLFKTDGWHCNTGHAKSAELAEACHSNGLQLCMYWDGPRSEEELAAEWTKSKFNYYRMDQWGKPPPFNINDYRSFTDFNRKVDNLYRKYGIKLENCCNGGNLRSLDLFRRMTFMTPSDANVHVPYLYQWTYMMCPIQIKIEFATDAKTSVAEWRTRLLGSILLGFPHAWDQVTIDNCKAILALYNNRQRAILRGADVYHILPPGVPNRWFVMQYYNTFINKGSVLLWQNGGPASQVVKLKGLDRAATYALAFEDAPEKNGTRTGAQLMDEGLNITMGPNASEIVWVDLAK